MKKIKIKRGEGISRQREGVRIGGERIFFFFASFSDLRKSDHRFSSGLKAKLIYAMRATRGHQKVGVSTNSMCKGFLILEALTGRLSHCNVSVGLRP